MYPPVWCPLHAQDHRLASGHFQRYTLHVEFQRRLILSNQGRLRLSFWISFSSVSVILQLASEVTLRAVFSKWMLWVVICTWQKSCIWDNSLLQLISSCCSASRAVPVPMSNVPMSGLVLLPVSSSRSPSPFVSCPCSLESFGCCWRNPSVLFQWKSLYLVSNIVLRIYPRR